MAKLLGHDVVTAAELEQFKELIISDLQNDNDLIKKAFKRYIKFSIVIHTIIIAICAIVYLTN